MNGISLQGFQRYLINTSWMIAEKIMRLVLALLVGIYVARYLGPEKFGLLNYAISIVAIFSVIANLGLDGIVVRNLVLSKINRDVIMGSAFVLRLIGTLLFFLIIIVAMQILATDRNTKIIVIVVSASILFQVFNIIDLYFQSQVLSKMSSLAQIFALFFSSALKVWLVYIKAPLIYFAGAISLEILIQGILFIVMYHRQRLKILKWKASYNIAKDLLKDSWPIIFAGMVTSIYMRIDQVMIKNMLSNEAVGSYAAAVRLSEAWYFLPMVLCNSLFPAIINAKKLDVAVYHGRLQKLYDLLAWIAIIIAIPTTICAGLIIGTLYGAEYSNAAEVLKIHIWTGVFVFIGVASGKWLIAENRQKITFFITAMGALVNVTMNLFLIPIWGISGAAISTLISQSVASYFAYGCYKTTRNTFWMQSKAFTFPIRILERIYNK